MLLLAPLHVHDRINDPKIYEMNEWTCRKGRPNAPCKKMMIG